MYPKSLFLLLSLSGALALAAPALAEDQPKVEFGERGLKLDLDDVAVTIGGRAHLDTVFAAEELGGDETDLRRARLEVGFELPGEIRLRADYDFAPNREGFRNLWVDYRGIDGVGIRAGQFVVPFSFEEMMESNDLTFMERAMPGALAPGFNAGIALRAAPGDWSLQAGVFFDPIDGSDPSDKGTSIAARAVYRPVSERDKVLHLGAALEYRDLAQDSRPRYRARQEQSFGSSRLNTRRIDDASNSMGTALEAIYLDGPLLLQAHGIHRRVETDLETFHFKGGHVQASYLFGMGRRRYSRTLGIPSYVDPASASGMWELGLRISHLDLEDGSIAGGRETNYGAAISWHANYNLKLSFNVIHANLSPDRSGNRISDTSAQGRLQIRF